MLERLNVQAKAEASSLPGRYVIVCLFCLTALHRSICFLLFAVLYIVSYFIITRYKRKTGMCHHLYKNSVSFVDCRQSALPFAGFVHIQTFIVSGLKEGHYKQAYAVSNHTYPCADK